MMWQIQYATEADMPALCEINYVSFKSCRFRSAFFFQSDAAVLREFKSLNGMKQLANPAMHIIKIDDPATGHTVGMSGSLSPRYSGHLLIFVP